MEKAKVLILGQPLEEGLSELNEVFQVDQAPLENTRDWLLENLADYDALYTTQLPVDKEMIDAGENLKIISTHSVGFDHIDIDYAKEKGIVVSNSPEAVMVPTAELAVTLMLSIMRHVAFLDRRLRDGEWVNTTLPSGLSQGLNGKTVGIFGFGRIGQEVAKMVQVFGATVIYNKRHPLAKDQEEELQVSYRDFDDLVREADVISLHAPATADTKGLFDEEVFSKMKEGAFLVNTARGALVDEEAMIAALKSGQLAGAGLDVYEVEGQSHPDLIKLDNVVMTPHSGSATWDARIKLSRETAQNIISYLNDGKIINQVNA